MRPNSATHRRWQAVELTAENRHMVYIPQGCAHGFQTLADDTELIYEITPAYAVSAARGIAWNDPALAVAWPIADPIMSPTDRDWPRLSVSAESEAR